MQVDSKNKNGSTSLMWASHRGHEGVAKLLVDCGAEASPAPKGPQRRDGSDRKGVLGRGAEGCDPTPSTTVGLTVDSHGQGLYQAK